VPAGRIRRLSEGGSVFKSIKVGRIEITALTDMEGTFFRLDQIFPGVAHDQWETYVRRYPWAFADSETLLGRVGSEAGSRHPDLAGFLARCRGCQRQVFLGPQGDRSEGGRPRPRRPSQALGDQRRVDGPEGGRLVGQERGIEVENLVREFRRGPRAVDGVDLRVEPGEVYGFLGPNGAGKCQQRF
jgi:ABC-type multidrug transport system fused ATPase/permease subunit